MRANKCTQSPVRNEQKTVERLYSQLPAECEIKDQSFEFLFSRFYSARTMTLIGDTVSKLLFFLAMILPATSFAENRESCEEACWACSASESALRSKYGSPRIPSRFKFAQRYDDMTSQEYKRCMAPHGPMAVLNRDISGRCTKQANSLCKRKCNTDLGLIWRN